MEPHSGISSRTQDRSELLMGRKAEWLAIAAAIATAILLGLRPYFDLLNAAPRTIDGVFWIVRGAPSHPDWVEWVFGTKHFGVGYRPIAALSYSLDYVVGGLDPFVYRATDLVLFALAGLLLLRMFRALAPELPRWAGVVAVAVFMGHPAGVETVPILARRSYLLAVVFSLAALAVFCHGLARERPSWKLHVKGACAGLLFCAAVLSNEGGAVTGLLLPMIAAHAAPAQARRAAFVARACIAPALLVLVAVACRHAVVGGLGGYTPQGDWTERTLSVFAATWHSLVPWTDLTDGRARASSLVFLALVLPFYGWFALVRPLRQSKLPGARLSVICAVWLFGYAALYAALGVWWDRMAFFLLAPFALLLASTLGATCAAPHARRRNLTLALLPQFVLLGAILWHSPAVLGLPAEEGKSFAHQAALLDNLTRDMSGLEEPALVLVVAPIPPTPNGLRRDGIAPLLWATALLEPRDVLLEGLVFYERSEIADAVPSIDRSGGHVLLRLPPGRAHLAPRRWRPRALPTRLPAIAPAPRDHPDADFVPIRPSSSDPAASIAIDLAYVVLPPDRRAYTYVYDGSAGSLAPIR